MKHGTLRARRLACALLACLATVSLSACLGPPKVSLDWPAGEIVFKSSRLREDPFEALFTMDAQGRRWAVLSGTWGSLDSGAAWSPDGRLAFEAVVVKGVEAQYSGLEGTVLLDGGGRKVPFGVCRHSVAWSPDGAAVAFISDCGHGGTLCVAAPDGTGEVAIVEGLPGRVAEDGTVQNMRLSWSRDSRRIAYDVRNERGEWEVWLVSADGSGRARLAIGRRPAWSPVRDEVAFDRDGDIWIASVETGAQELLVDDPVRAEWPAWSPDGRELAFVSWRDDRPENRSERMPNTEIYKVRRDGTGLANLTRNVAWDDYPVWRPKARSGTR